MPTAHPSRTAELVLPVASLAALRRTLAESVGDDDAAIALREAGRAAGAAFFASLAPNAGGDADAAARELRELPTDQFWTRIAQLLSARGWGRLSHTSPHPGVGALSADDWVEADPDAQATRPSCYFTTGLLADLLGRVAGADMAVLEVECRSRGDARCRFLFGSPAALDALFAELADGRPADAALDALA